MTKLKWQTIKQGKRLRTRRFLVEISLSEMGTDEEGNEHFKVATYIFDDHLQDTFKDLNFFGKYQDALRYLTKQQKEITALINEYEEE